LVAAEGDALSARSRLKSRKEADLNYYHATDAVVSPGDVIRSAAARGHRSRHAETRFYDPTLVYVVDEHADPIRMEQHGSHLYRVRPLGPVRADPERDPGRWPVASEDPAAFSWACDAAIVLHVVY
jgi:hypothetical protein